MEMENGKWKKKGVEMENFKTKKNFFRKTWKWKKLTWKRKKNGNYKKN